MAIKKPIISTIIRISDPRYIWQLEEALFSLENMLDVDGPREAIVVSQNFNESDIFSLMNVFEYFSDRNFKVKNINYVSEKNKDEREKLLNVGVETATGRFIAFLDYDDLMYPDAYKYLMEESLSAKSPIVFGSIRVSRSDRNDRYSYLYAYENPFERERNLFELWYDNFCPIHSFVIDTNLIPKKEIYFEEGLKKAEDYALLLKITSKYGALFIDKLVGEYQYRNDGTNTVQASAGDLNVIKNQGWITAKRRLNEIKGSLKPNVTLNSIENYVNKYKATQREVAELREYARLGLEYKKVLERVNQQSKLLSSYLDLLGNLTSNYDRGISSIYEPRFAIDDNIIVKKNAALATQLRFWATSTKKDKEFGEYWVIFKYVNDKGQAKFSFSSPSIPRPDVMKHFKLSTPLVSSVIDFPELINVDRLEVYLMCKKGKLIKAERH